MGYMLTLNAEGGIAATVALPHVSLSYKKTLDNL